MQGSVAFKLAKALEFSGFRTGLFVSPHVSCFRERMQVNGKLISEDDVIRHLTKVHIRAHLFMP
jgi:dihydrofolate synthase / folylpolyglutamate synthase